MSCDVTISGQDRRRSALDWFARPDFLAFYQSFETEYLAAPRIAYLELALALHGKPEPRVLDVGCGTGTALAYLENRGVADCVAGLDPDPAMIGEARRRLRAEAVLVTAGVEDLQETSLAGHAFDLILSYSNLRLWEEPVRGLANIHAALAPGGLAYVLDLTRDAAQEVVEEIALRIPGEEERAYFLAQISAGYTVAEVRQLAEAAGVDATVTIGGLGGICVGSPEFYKLIQHSDRLADAVLKLPTAPLSTASSSSTVLHMRIERPLR